MGTEHQDWAANEKRLSEPIAIRKNEDDLNVLPVETEA